MRRLDIIDQICKELRTDGQKRIFGELAKNWDRIEQPDRRLDAHGMVFATRQLEHVMSDVYEVRYPDLPVIDGVILPIDTSVDEGAKTWVYYLYDGTAVARWGGQGGDSTLPSVTRKGAEVSKPVRKIENEYGYDTDDLRHAAYARMPLDRDLAKLARRGHDQKAHRAGLWGNTKLGLDGLLNHRNITVLTAAESFATADVDDIVETFGALIDHAGELSNGLRNTTRVLMSRRVYNLLRRRRIGPGDGAMTILDYIRGAWSGKDGGIAVEFMILNELDWTKAQSELAADEDGTLDVDIDSTTGDCLFAYIHNDPEVARFVQPMEFYQHPVQTVGLRFMIPCESKWGGLRLTEPPVFVRMEGVYEAA